MEQHRGGFDRGRADRAAAWYAWTAELQLRWGTAFWNMLQALLRGDNAAALHFAYEVAEHSGLVSHQLDYRERQVHILHRTVADCWARIAALEEEVQRLQHEVPQ